MSDERLWAPWRLGYIQGSEAKPAEERPLQVLEGGDPQCFLCRYVVDTEDAQNLVVHRGELTITVLNRYPYNNGHLLVAPRRHQGTLADLTADEQLECVQVMTRMTAALERLMNPQGFNIGLNLGRVAGAGLPGHLHWHIVPRWSGDNNFMPVLAGARVIPQSLEALCELLTTALRENE